MLALAAIHVSVFGLFHPVALTVQPAPGTAVVVQTAQASSVLEGVQSRVLSTMLNEMDGIEQAEGIL